MRHAGQGGQATDPLEQGRLVIGGNLWVVEVDIPVHPATEGFVLRVTTATEAVVFPRGTGIARLIVALPVHERDATANPIGSVLGDLNSRWAHLVHPVADFDTRERIAQRARWAGAYRAHDLVHPGAIGRHEPILTDVERRGQSIRAEARMGADAPVVEHCNRRSS